jgi:hypothetical protein
MSSVCLASIQLSGKYGTTEFGNAIESRITERVGKVTGQQFPLKNPSSNGADLVPFPK